MFHEHLSVLNSLNIYNIQKSYGILGIINLNLYNYIISISDARIIGKIGNIDIFHIHDVQFIQIDYKIEGKNIYNYDFIYYEINQLIIGIRKILREGVFFSREYDLTNSLQMQKNIKLVNNGSYDVIKHANAKFLFNNQVLNSFYQNNVFSNDFLVNCIYGYVNILNENINNTDISYILISRKNVNNLDLKRYSLGFNENGYMSNLVETEQIFLCSRSAFSYVLLKSPPLIKNKIINEINNNFKDEKKIRDINFNENLHDFSNHLEDLNRDFRFTYLINLLDKNNFQENIFNNIIEHNIKNTPNTSFKYNYYNFDEMCLANSQKNYIINNNLMNFNIDPNNTDNNKKNKDNIEIFLNGIENVLTIFKYFGITFDSQNMKSLIDQIGIIRVFCKDGSERSNIIEMRIGWMILEYQLKSLKINPVEFFGADIISVKEYERMGIQNTDFVNNPNKNGIEFIIKFKKFWKENSQMLNMHYSGINKLSHISGQLDGNETNKLFLDIDEHLRQNCLDLFLDKMQVKINTSIFHKEIKLKIKIINYSIL